MDRARGAERDYVNTRHQILCVWSGVLCPIVMFTGLWPMAGFFPPHHPTASAADIAAIYQQGTSGIRLGMIFIMLAGALNVPFVAAIAAQMLRIESGRTPVLSMTQLGAGAAGALLFIIPALIWTAAAFRPDRPADITLALNDIGWISFVMPFTLAVVQNCAIGLAIVSDRNAQPVFPRWLGFFNFWVVLLFLPGGLLTFFKTGPFAWNGLLAFWVPATVFGAWYFVMAAFVIKAARQQAA